MSVDAVTPRVRLARDGEPSTSAMQLAMKNAGIRRGGRAMTFAIAWAVAEAALGHELGEGQGVTAAIEEYRAWWREAQRTTWRDLEAFREAFPGEETPARLIALMGDARVAKKNAAAGLGGLPLVYA